MEITYEKSSGLIVLCDQFNIYIYQTMILPIFIIFFYFKIIGKLPWQILKICQKTVSRYIKILISLVYFYIFGLTVFRLKKKLKTQLNQKWVGRYIKKIILQNFENLSVKHQFLLLLINFFASGRYSRFCKDLIVFLLCRNNFFLNYWDDQHVNSFTMVLPNFII